MQVNPLVKRPHDSALLEEYQKLLLSEKECQQAIRDIEWEVSEIIRTRTNQVRRGGPWQGCIHVPRSCCYCSIMICCCTLV